MDVNNDKLYGYIYIYNVIYVFIIEILLLIKENC